MLVALTRPVPPTIAQCELTHLERTPIDFARASEQHEAYENALRAIGCTVRRLPAAPDHPDSVFIEDTAVVFDECAIITRPGAESRRGETTAVVDALRQYRRLHPVTEPGTLDGGDVLVVGHRVFVGLSTRTNKEGAAQVAKILERFGYVVWTVPVTNVLHLKSAATALDEDRILLNRRLTDAELFRDVELLDVDESEPMAANVLCVDGKVLCAADAPRTRAILERAGYTVTAIDSSELAKAEGGLTCCSLLVREG